MASKANPEDCVKHHGPNDVIHDFMKICRRSLDFLHHSRNAMNKVKERVHYTNGNSENDNNIEK